MAGNPAHVGAKLDYSIVLITAVLCIGNLAIATHRSSRVYLYQQLLCSQYLWKLDPANPVYGSEIDEALCRIPAVQSPLSTFEGFDMVLQLVPALVVLGAYQELLPLFGLRRLITTNLCLAALAVFLSTTFFKFHQAWSPYAILLTYIFDLVGGGDIVRVTIAITCIAAISPPEKLTTSYNYISSLYYVSSLVASALGSALLSNHVYMLNFCSLFFFGIAIVFALQLPSSLGRQINQANGTPASPSYTQLMAEQPDHNSSLLETAPMEELHDKGGMVEVFETLLKSWRAPISSMWNLFQIPNPTFTTLLNWSLAKANLALAIKNLVSAIMLFLLPRIRRKFLEPKLETIWIDLLITRCSLLACAVGVLGMGLSILGPFTVLALCIYTLGVGFLDSLTAFGTLTLLPGYTASDLYVKTGLIQTISGMVGASFWSGLFAYTVKKSLYPLGLPFLFCALLFISGALGAGLLKKWVPTAAL